MIFEFPKMTFRKHLSTLLFVVLIMHFANFIIIPILPVLLSVDKGLSPSKIGYIIGIGFLTFQVGSIIGGLISDRIGRKITLVIGSAIEVIAYIGFGISNSYMFFLLFQILNGIGSGIYAPTIKAAIAEHASESIDMKTTAFSLRGIAANLGIALGGLLPFLIIGLSFTAYFFISAAVYLGLLFISLLFIPNSCVRNNTYGYTSLKNYLKIINNKSFIIFSAKSISVWAVYSQLSILLPLRATAIFNNGKIVGGIWTITSIIVVLFQTTITRRIIRKISLLSAISWGTIVMGIGIFLIGYSNTYIFLLFSATIFIIGEMLSTPTIDSIVSELADNDNIGAYFSVANITYGLGTALGSFISGRIIGIYGIYSSVPWNIFLILSILVGVIVYIFRKKIIVQKNRTIPIK